MLETLNKKLDEISKSKEQTIAQLNALLGAEQAIKQLIDEIDKKEEE
jgi:hypothetical protein